ncbi:hypothetical protein ACSDQ9_10550 [Aestuariimicrobium soli]|uniref:hypothetical protein n=1 Tax=Aestuariimicrobium soli TaxID=2035834 RepID=UPI003EC1025E
MPTLPALDDPASYLRPDGQYPERPYPEKECDVIMKGGITSGVVYPLAVCRLATEHRVRQLGGSSAGAIAAALAAAAEHGRSSGSSDPQVGYPRLAQLPDFLGHHLLGLFQPMAETRAAFDLVMGALAAPTTAGKVRRVAVASVRSRPLLFWAPVAVAVVVLAGLVLLASGVLGSDPLRPAALVVSLVLALLVLAVVVIVGLVLAARAMLTSTLGEMNRRGFGLVNGHDPTGQSLPLTDWLTRTINETAGLSADGRPLTLGDLWGERATEVHRRLSRADNHNPAAWVEFDPDVTLVTTTTCLNQGRPYQMPFTSDVFHFCPRCLADYFPDTVMAHLAATARPATQARDADRVISMVCPRHAGTRVMKLPEAADLPVVMLARLSLSFPVLICAVPLHHIDFSRGPGKRELVVDWFSDGGIANNFPMQFFDRLLPTRPTFGINLHDAHPDYPDIDVHQLPQTGQRLVRSLPVTSVAGLFAGVRRTWQDWSDQLQMEVPGFRDRIVEVSMHPGEGGLNLAMPPAVIGALSERGDRAGQRLSQFDLSAHRWIRFRTAMATLSQVLEDLHGQTVDDLPQPWSGSYRFSSDSREAAVRTELAQLQELARQWRDAGHPATSDGTPQPLPQLRHVLRR